MMLKIYINCFLLFLYIHTDIKTLQITEISTDGFIKQHSHAKAIKSINNYPFHFKPYPLYPEFTQEKYPNKGFFQNVHILSIPNGTAYFCNYNLWGINGLVFINNFFIKECQIKHISPFDLQKTKTITVEPALENYKLDGRLAICSHLYPDCYGHFMLDVLCQLALLEIYNIDYDYLCIPYHASFMQEALELWGINSQKIIPLSFGKTITAHEIILPTSVTQTIECVFGANYSIDFLIKYVQEKLLNAALQHSTTNKNSSKIFISRKDAPHNKRLIPNEDEIFKLFEAQQFQRYELTKLSLVEQILLFHNAQEIVSFVGSGSLNSMFSQPGTTYIEIVQSMIDATFFFLADIFNLTYYCIDATNKNTVILSSPHAKAEKIDLKLIETFLKNYHL